MDSRHGYRAAEVPALGVLTTDQRRRAEALTLARALIGTGAGTTLSDWLRFADYVITGDR